ncbi:glycoside hydrolase family 65 protein [Sphingomonas alpina]|uniref:Glycoside hydrolase family 65 protein n=1 Tax=Sphingomonas alpina TaxID=653931 RepID=A0A7H0LGA1_9SPHN|nr:glycoside hydrolase family 65 protein [Sphingomonas alpina]QNQ08704.1 glycoside hydrolase family 65 protein [Sphingomonas alpina]
MNAKVERTEPASKSRIAIGDGGWTLSIDGPAPTQERWAETIFALANGAIGVRASIDELGGGDGSTFLTAAYEVSPIVYHERFRGFAETTDTRVPVAEAIGLDVAIGGSAIDFTTASAERTRRTLDLRSGVLTRETRWRLADGRRIAVRAERLVPLDGTTGYARRIAVSPIGFAAAIALTPRLLPAPTAAGQADDPRLGVNLHAHGFAPFGELRPEMVVEKLRGSGIAVAATQAIRGETQAQVVADGSISIEIFTGYAVVADATDPNHLSDIAAATAADLADTGFDALVDRQRAALDAFWRNAVVEIEGDEAAQGCETAATLRLNLFHLFQSAGRDGQGSAAAKGLTGQGYEGHYFWDTEVFMLPVLAVSAPEIARAMLAYRYATLDAAIANARALNHDQGALYAWRTIAGRECSAHYPSGSAEYHINAAIAYAIGFYDKATGDTGFLVEMGAEMLVQTARLWIALGAHEARTGQFCIRGVTGPDEYTALIDNNWYTNRMAQAHLRLAAEVVDRVAAAAPDAWANTAARIGYTPAEATAWTAAADAMRLPYDEKLRIDAQDDSFLDKPRWDLAGTPADKFPLLLHYHPMTLYRHQVAKQADLVLGLVLGGDGIDRERKRRAYDHYDSVTAHDSTLSACSFSILASDVGRSDEAWRHFRSTAFVDVDDLHHNTDHGVHMAAMAGSWLAFAWGFGGFRLREGAPSFAPTLPAAWRGYGFAMLWRGSRLRIDVDAGGATYRNLDGPAVSFAHRDQNITLAPGETRRLGA